jgi:hypothetical protein
VVLVSRLLKGFSIENPATYFLSCRSGLSFDVPVMRRLHELGHEVGYHYECMDACSLPRKGYDSDDEGWAAMVDMAYEDFRANLERMREVVPVRTAAMHGSPRSRFNNLDIWKRHDYRELGIIGEPYLDIDFSDVFYLTDTGRRWDGASVSVRDKVVSGFSGPEFVFRSTSEIIAAAEQGRLPSRIMINMHPQRWTDSYGPWLKELVWQNMKNVVKGFLVRG